MGSYIRNKDFRDEEGRVVDAQIVLSRSADMLSYYRNNEPVFSMDIIELENFIAMVRSTGYPDMDKEL